MTVEEMKNELKHMEDPMLKEITSFILKLRRLQDPGRSKKITDLLDSPKANWMSLDDVEKRWGEK